MGWKLKAVEYGKIKSVEIEAAPLTLFVGDNNSGKSYLMSLLWGIQNLGIQTLIGKNTDPDTEAGHILFEWMNTQVRIALEKNKHTFQIGSMAVHLQSVLQEKVNQNKDEFVKKIFNSSNVKIKELQIELMDIEKVSLSFDVLENKSGVVLHSEKSDRFIIRFLDVKEKSAELNEISYAPFLEAILCILMDIEAGDINWWNRSIYLPATRTGFMLTKDIINKMGRKAIFNIEMEQEEVSPFTRPVNQFLDVINDLSFDRKGEEGFAHIVKYIENGMADGTIEMSALPNKEVSYVPAGGKTGIPLRIVSAVVTELSPLILILKHKENLKTLFYEEPEMCLHPQFQQKMAKVLCRLVNAGLNMAVTTHSDIILQHINNMIRLSARTDAAEICSQYGYDANDLLLPGQVKVYQFKTGTGTNTEVEEIICGENGFAISTFNDALDKIMDEAYTIQE